MSDWTIGGITLPGDLEWTDRTRWSAQKQSETLSLAGGVIVQRSTQPGGRPMTLETSARGVFVSYAHVQAMLQLLATENTVTVIEPDSTEHLCRFRHADGPPVDAAPLYYRSPPSDSDPYNMTIRLMVI